MILSTTMRTDTPTMKAMTRPMPRLSRKTCANIASTKGTTYPRIHTVASIITYTTKSCTKNCQLLKSRLPNVPRYNVTDISLDSISYNVTKS